MGITSDSGSGADGPIIRGRADQGNGFGRRGGPQTPLFLFALGRYGPASLVATARAASFDDTTESGERQGSGERRRVRLRPPRRLFFSDLHLHLVPFHPNRVRPDAGLRRRAAMFAGRQVEAGAVQRADHLRPEA